MPLKPAVRQLGVSVGRWSALAFILNLIWEIAHVRLYTLWTTEDAAVIAWSVFHCTLGDVLIALGAFALAGLIMRRVDWPGSRPWSGGMIVLVASVAYTAWSEWYNVYRVASWGYASNMPMLFGIGLSPLLQWLAIPPILVAVTRLVGARNCSTEQER